MAQKPTTVQVAVDLPLRTLLSYLAPAEGAPEPGTRVRVSVRARACTGLVVGSGAAPDPGGFKLKPIVERLDERPLLDPTMMKLLGWCADYYLHPPGEVFMGALPKALRGSRKCPEAEAPPQEPAQATTRQELNQDQARAVRAVTEARPYLLEGVTGSGKTEVYMELIARTMREGRQSMLLLPEIGLAPQNLERLRQRLQCRIAVIHSGRSDKQRLDAWLAARAGLAPLVVGTRSALWTPLKRPGLIVVDEEHDSSFKQQDGFRYMARDVAVMRAKMEGTPIVLGSATPSLESIFNAQGKRYVHLELPRRAGQAKLPAMEVIELQNCRMHGAISEPLLQIMRETLGRGKKALLFIGRRGYSPILLCHSCGSRELCPKCDRAMTLHKYPAPATMRCHLCGRVALPPDKCGQCDGRLVDVGHGTQRIEESLGRLFPETSILRFDSDRTRRKGALPELLRQAHSDNPCIMVGTQMIAKGHHLSDLALVGILDIDRALYSHNFRSMEIAAQQVIQVAGRAGRGDGAGRVVLQTHHPGHQFVQRLLRHGYSGFARDALRERRQTGLPPFTRMALLQAESRKAEAAHDFLRAALRLAPRQDGISHFGPFPAVIQKRAGMSREQVVITAPRTGALQRALRDWLPRIDAAKRNHVSRWFVDVDPLELN